MLLLVGLTLFQNGCDNCTEEKPCLVERIGNVECQTIQEADEFGGCGTTGFFDLHGQEVAFSSQLCTTTTSTATSPQIQTEETPRASSSSLKTGEIVGIVVGAVALVAAAMGITWLIGSKKNTTTGNYKKINPAYF